VLITGESGHWQGAWWPRPMHKHGPRAKAQFMALNLCCIRSHCGERGLFGHEKGDHRRTTADSIGK